MKRSVDVEQAVRKPESTPNKTFTVEGQFLLGLPKAVILDEAEKWGADLIVVGSHGYPGLGTLSSGFSFTVGRFSREVFCRSRS